MESARAHGGQASFAAADSQVRHADVFDVTFPGHGGDPIFLAQLEWLAHHGLS